MRRGTRWDIPDDAPLSMPNDLTEVFRLRVAGVIAASSAPEAMQELLYRLAVSGRSVPWRLLMLLLENEERPWPLELIERLLGELQQHHLVSIERETAPPKDEPLQEHNPDTPETNRVVFEHALVPQVLLLEVEKSLAGPRLHRTVAQAKQQFYAHACFEHADELAAHLQRAGATRQALPYLVQAAEHRKASGDLQGALSRYERAEELFQQAQTPPDPEEQQLQYQVWLGLAELHLQQGQYERAESFLQHLVGHLEQNPATHASTSLMARGLLHLGQLYTRQNRPSQAHPVLERAYQHAQRAQLSGVSLEVRPAQGEMHLAHQGGWSEATLQKLERDLESLTNNLPLLKSRGLRHLGAQQQARGDLALAERYLARARLIVDEIGAPYSRAPIYNDLGYILLLQGRTAEGEGILRQSLAICREQDDTPAQSLCLFRLGLAAWQRDDDEQALTMLDASLQLQRELALYQPAAETLELQGRIYEARGQFDQARRTYRHILDHHYRWPPEFESQVHMRLGSTFLKENNPEKARSHLELASQGFGALGNLYLQVQCLNLLSMATSWRGENMLALALVKQSAHLARVCGDSAGEIFALTALALITWLSPMAGEANPHQTLRQARMLEHNNPSPHMLLLLTTMEGILQGLATDAISPDLPPLQRAWLENVLTPRAGFKS